MTVLILFIIFPSEWLLYYTSLLQIYCPSPPPTPPSRSLCRSLKYCRQVIKTLCCVFRWFPEVQTIFYQGNKRKQVPSNQEQEKLESFFNCAATLMTENLQQLTLHSIDDYTDLLCQPPVSLVLGHPRVLLQCRLAGTATEVPMRVLPSIQHGKVALRSEEDVEWLKKRVAHFCIADLGPALAWHAERMLVMALARVCCSLSGPW